MGIMYSLKGFSSVTGKSFLGRSVFDGYVMYQQYIIKYHIYIGINMDISCVSDHQLMIQPLLEPIALVVECKNFLCRFHPEEHILIHHRS